MSTPAQYATVSDEQLASHAQDGCRKSFGELDRRLRPRLQHVLERRLGNRTDAEDLVQQTMLRVYEKLHLYDCRQRLSPWIFTIALRLAASRQRRKVLPVGQETSHLQQVEADLQSPEDHAIASETREYLWTLADRVLPSEQWTALWLFYGEDQSVREVAQAMNRTRASVSVLLFRARKNLLPHLQESEEVDSASVPQRTPERQATPHVFAGSKP